MELIRGNRGRLFLSLSYLAGNFATDSSNFTFQISQSRFPGIVPDNGKHSFIANIKLLWSQPILIELLENKKLLSDMELLILSIAGQLNYLHSVQQGWRNGVDDVTCGDEHDLGQVKGHIKVMVNKRGVLLRVENFEKGGSRVASEINTQFVNLIEHK